MHWTQTCNVTNDPFTYSFVIEETHHKEPAHPVGFAFVQNSLMSQRVVGQAHSLTYRSQMGLTHHSGFHCHLQRNTMYYSEP